MKVNQESSWLRTPIIIAVLLYFLYFMTYPPTRVGDASEYYAQFLSFVYGNTPWLGNAGLAEYTKLFNSNVISGLISPEQLTSAFPSLAIHENQWDFNHFWFYPFLAAIFGKIGFLAGFQLNPQVYFLALHALMTIVALLQSRSNFGLRGVVAMSIVLFMSPAIWFSNHVHTEYFTIVLTSVAVMYVLKAKYLWGAIGFALASTQNPSFALLSVIIILYQLKIERRGFFSKSNILIVSAALVICSLHPFYFYFRYEALTPQSLAGGLSPLVNVKESGAWLFDLDIGLFPNWPLAFFALVLASIILFSVSQRKPFVLWTSQTKHYIAFVVIYVLISLLAQSSTTNINSGATPGIARYATWYFALFLPVFLFLLTKINLINKYKSKQIFLSLALISILYNQIENFQNKPETYTVPSRPGYLVQKLAPWAYFSPNEIFAERYSGLGEGVWVSDINAVVGPDCRKTLLISNVDVGKLTNAFGCSFTDSQLSEANLAIREFQGSPKYFFLNR
jgi:hypothetical protein